MQHSLSLQNNRYLKQTHELPTGLTISTPSHQTIPNYIPSVPVKTQVSTPYGAQKLANTIQPGASNARKWEDIITNPTLTQTVLKTSESTMTFRSPTNGKRLSNKELLAKADLILAKSPKKLDNLTISSQRETITASSNNPLYSNINTFSSPVKVNMPPSYPSSVHREITSLQLNNYGIHENIKASAAPLNFFTPPQILSPACKEKLDEVVDKILKREGHATSVVASPVRHETYVYKAPIEVQARAEQRTVPLLTSAPRVNPYLNSQSSGVQRRQSELSEIQRDFLQLKITSQRTQGLKDAATPTPFISGYASNNAKASSFGTELLMDDRDSVNVRGENRLLSDRESYNEQYVESLPKKETRINRYINPKQPQQDPPRVYRLGEQSGGSQIPRTPYQRPQSSQNIRGDFIAVSRAREISPDFNNEINSEAFRGVKQTTERNRITSSEYMIERQEDVHEIRRSIAIEEELKRKDQQEKMASLSERERRGMITPKSEGVMLSPSSYEYTTRKPEESSESWRRERVNKYTNKVEVSIEVRPDLVGKEVRPGTVSTATKGKQPKVMSKQEKFFG